MLVDFTKAREIIPKFSANNVKKFEPISQEVEDYYLPRILGRGFAYDVQKTPGSYIDLLNGVEFQDCNDETVYFKGLYYVLTYYIFAQYIGESKVQDTYTGFAEKNRADANSSTQGQESTLKNTNRKYAESEVEVMKEYLNEANKLDPNAYPLWSCSNPQTGKLYTPKYYTVKKTRS